MENQILVSRDGHFYRAQRALLKTRFLRIGDDFVCPNPKELRFATLAELNVLKMGMEAEGVEVPCLSQMRMKAVQSNNSETLNQVAEEEEPLKVGSLEYPTEHFDWGKLVLYPSAVQSIRMAVNSIQNRAQLEEAFNISSIDPSAKCLINFYGPPGTGKTMAAKAVARELGKPLLQADYSQITSKWVGETSKGIQLLFQEAAERDAVLFLDEADSLASRRLDSPSDSAGVHFNQEKNVFMQELDKFQGVVIMTTNLFQNYDDALLRRIAEHVRFDMPDMNMRECIIRQLFAKTVKIHVDYKNLAKITEGFSGGDLLNVAKNSVKLASLNGKDPAKWLISDETVVAVIKQIQESKQATGAYGGKRPMGLCAG
jgi:SpoVK/Ycf46/Vps4 family AAA+-type ATPase